jgi:hypothetical protein
VYRLLREPCRVGARADSHPCESRSHPCESAGAPSRNTLR